jgi:hypothetical protein
MEQLLLEKRCHEVSVSTLSLACFRSVNLDTEKPLYSLALKLRFNKMILSAGRFTTAIIPNYHLHSDATVQYVQVR